MLSDRLTRVFARVVLATYTTHLFAPLVQATEGEVAVLSSQNLLAKQWIERGSSANPLEGFKPLQAPIAVHPEETPLPLKTEATGSLPSLKPHQHLPTLSIRLDSLPQNTKGRAYRLSVERTNPLESGDTLTNFQWQKDFFFPSLKTSGASSSSRSRVIRFPLLGSLNLTLSEFGQLTAFSTIDSSGSYQAYNYHFHLDNDLHLTNLMTNGRINVKQAQVISAEGEVYGQEGIFLNGDKEIKTRSENPLNPTHLHSRKRISFKSAYLDNENSCIEAPTIKGILGRGGQRGASLDNTNGVIEATDLLSLTLATEVFNENGILNASAGKTKVSIVETLLNKKGFVGGKRGLDLTVKGKLQNPGGKVGSERTTTVNAQKWSNSDGAQVWGRNLEGKSHTLKTDDTSRIEIQNSLDLAAHILHQESPLMASKVQVQTIQALDLATALAPSTLSLSTEEGPIIYKPKGLRAHKLLSLTSKNTPMALTIPLKSPGAFEATAPEILNKTTVAIKEQVTLNGTSTDVPYPVRNEGDLTSATKGLTIKGQGFSHTKEGHLQVAEDAVFPSQNLRLHGSTHIGGNTHLKFLKEQKGDPELTHNIDFSKTTVEGLLHLTLGQDTQKLTVPIAIPGHLEIDREGNSPEPLHLLANLIAKKGLKVRLPEAPLIVGAEEESQPMVKLQASEGFMDIQSKSLDLVKAQLFSRTGMHWKVREKRIQIGRGVVENVPIVTTHKGPYFHPILYRRYKLCQDRPLHPELFENASFVINDNEMIDTFPYPFTLSNGTMVITEGPFTALTPEGILINQAELQVQTLDVTTEAPVRNEGGNITVQGNAHIHPSKESLQSGSLLQNILLTRNDIAWGGTSAYGGRHRFNNFNFKHPFSHRGTITIGGNLQVGTLEDLGGLVYIQGKFPGVVDGKPFTPTQNYSGDEYHPHLLTVNPYIQEKFLSEVTLGEALIERKAEDSPPKAKDRQLEGVIQSKFIFIAFDGKFQIGKLANYQRPPTPPFQQMKMFVEVNRPTALFKDHLASSSPWIRQPIFPLSYDMDLAPAVVMTPEGLRLLKPSEKLLFHPLEEVGDLPRVLNAQLKRGCLDWENTDTRETYRLGRQKAYDLYQKLFAPKALEQAPVDEAAPSGSLMAANQTRALTATVNQLTEEEQEQLKFMVLYYASDYEGQTTYLPVSWVSPRYDDPRVRNPDGGIFGDVVVFKGLNEGAILHNLSTIHGESLLGIDVHHTINERQSHHYVTYQLNTFSKKGSWWRGDSYHSEIVAIHHYTPQSNTGKMTTGKKGQLALKSPKFELKNGAHLEAGAKGIAVDIDHLIASPAVGTSLGYSHSSAGGTSITQYYPIYTIQPALITSDGGVKGPIRKADLTSTHMIAYNKDINLEGKKANFSAHRELQKLGTTVTKEGRAVTVTERSTEIAMPCVFKAFNGNVLLSFEDHLHGMGTQFYGKLISLDSEDTDIDAILMAATTNITSTTSGMFSNQTVTAMQESPTAVRCVFEGEEVHFRGGKAKVGGAHISTRILYDHTTGGFALNPTIRKMHSRQVSKMTQPWASSEVGREGWQEFMIPTVVEADEINRPSPDGKMILNSVEYDKLKTTIKGNFEETYYQLQSWERTWAEHHQAIPNEALMVAGLVISIATYGTGTGVFLASSCGLELAAGGMGAAMANAGAATLFSGAVSSFGRTGDLAATVQEVCSPQNLKALGISMASAGLCHEIFSALKIPTNPALKAATNKEYIPGFTDFLQSSGLKAAINVPLNIAGGQSASDALATAVKDVPLNALAAFGAYNIGVAGSKVQISPLQQDFVHALFAAPLGAIQHPDKPLEGAITASANAFLAARASKMMFGSPEEMKEQAKQQLREEGRPVTTENIQQVTSENLYWKSGFISILNASLTAAITRDPAMVATSIFTAQNVVENNCVPSMTKSLLVSEGLEYSEKDRKDGFWQDEYRDSDELYYQMLQEEGDEPRGRSVSRRPLIDPQTYDPRQAAQENTLEEFVEDRLAFDKYKRGSSLSPKSRQRAVQKYSVHYEAMRQVASHRNLIDPGYERREKMASLSLEEMKAHKAQEIDPQGQLSVMGRARLDQIATNEFNMYRNQEFFLAVGGAIAIVGGRVGYPQARARLNQPSNMNRPSAEFGDRQQKLMRLGYKEQQNLAPQQDFQKLQMLLDRKSGLPTASTIRTRAPEQIQASRENFRKLLAGIDETKAMPKPLPRQEILNLNRLGQPQLRLGETGQEQAWLIERVPTKDQPWTIRPGQEWKEKIIGKAQRTGTPGHATRSYREAIKDAKQPDTKKVYLNRGYRGITGESVSVNRRPDTTTMKTDGKVNALEVKSKTDKKEILYVRNEEVMQQLPKNMQGTISIIKPSTQ